MKISTISVRPGTVLGYRCDGRPIYPIAGASPDGDGAAGGDGQNAGQNAGQGDGQNSGQNGTQANSGGQQGNAGTGQGATQQQVTEYKWDGKIESLPPEVQKVITEARADAGKARTTAKEQAAEEARTELLAKLGLNGDGTEKVDPDKLAEQLASKDAQLLQLQRETAVNRIARTPAIGADVDALLDSRKFVTQLADLKPDSKTFDDDVKTLVEAAVKENPKFKLAQAAGVSGGQFTGGSGEGTKRPTSIGAAIAARNAS